MSPLNKRCDPKQHIHVSSTSLSFVVKIRNFLIERDKLPQSSHIFSPTHIILLQKTYKGGPPKYIFHCIVRGKSINEGEGPPQK